MITEETKPAREARNPPTIVNVYGEVAPNGETIGLHILRREHSPVELYLHIEDVQHMVSILLALSCEAKRLLAPPDIERPPVGALPLPLSSINVGRDDHDRTFLTLEVGTAALMFGMPDAALAEVGQTLLTLSARAGGRPS